MQGGLMRDRHDMDRGQERVENPAKRFLQRYIWLRKQRDAIQEEIREHYDSVTRCTVRMNPIKVSGSGGAYDRMAEDICVIVDTKARLERVCYRLDCQMAEIMDAINALSDERYKSVLLYRYVRGMSWEDIMERMGYEKTQTLVMHGRALLEMNENMKRADENGLNFDL